MKVKVELIQFVRMPPKNKTKTEETTKLIEQKQSDGEHHLTKYHFNTDQVVTSMKHTGVTKPLVAELKANSKYGAISMNLDDMGDGKNLDRRHALCRFMDRLGLCAKK